MLILDSGFWGENTYLGGKFDAFLMFFVFWAFFWGGDLGFWGEIPPGDSWN